MHISEYVCKTCLKELGVMLKCRETFKKFLAACNSSKPKTFDFSQNFSAPFHRVTFDHSISCVLLIDKPNESCQNSKKFERNAISTTK